ncbi:MAG: menaquinol oxidoreductase [Desulfuromonadales bacterium GWC2_61_20]|nr:MAG: menaquinol oxidoreductase [Desulfuromonadales bacterium GWC2_61_20]HAD03409.1 menaquinol oxidoreductase [Desulfuromonas sp.]
MQLISSMVIVAVAPLLLAAWWMDEQPSSQAYDAPVLTAPAGSVPFSATAMVAPPGELHNPLPPTEASRARGATLFAINCALCHGQIPGQPGPVGRKFAPPPPGLGRALVQGRGDAAIFSAITVGFGRMPPFGDKLLPQERWDLVNFLRTGH